VLSLGQFASADVMLAAGEKVRSRRNNGVPEVILCERGTSVGAEQLIFDVRNLTRMRTPDYLVALDATHAAQRPAYLTRDGKGSAGDLFAVRAIARAGAAAGVDGMFLEVHETPSLAPVDQKVQLDLAKFEPFLKELIELANVSRWREDVQSEIIK
jgi:2-dehydro-3-deoxyphosphooctonate aldolase (KDO 8-P synthase)